MAYIFTITFISKLVLVEMACLLDIQNEIKAVIHYLKNKVGVVDFANAQGLVMF